MKKRILFIMMSLYNGGAERSLVNLLQEIDPDRYDIDLVLIKKEGIFIDQLPSYVNLLETPDSFKLFYSRYKPGIKSSIALLYKIAATCLSKVLSKNIVEMRLMRWNVFYDRWIAPMDKEYDLAVGYISGETGYFLKKVKAAHKIVWVHNDYRDAMYSPKYDRPHFAAVDDIVTVSESCKQILLEEFPEFADKIHYIPNITSGAALHKKADEFYPAEYEGVEVPILVSVGRLNEQKGFDMAVEAAALLKQRGVKFCWYVLGDGELRADLERAVVGLDVADVIRFIGTRANPYPYIKNAALLIQPSRYEGKSVVLDESKIIGTPILATDYNTVRDQLCDGSEGVVVELSAKGVADGIEGLLGDTDRLGRLHDKLQSGSYDNAEDIKLYQDLFDKYDKC